MGALFPFSLDWLDWKNYLPFGLGATSSAIATGEIQDSWRLKDGTAITLRAVRQADSALIQELVSGLSLQSRYHRFFYPLHELPPDMLARFTQNDPSGAMTLLAVVRRGGRETAAAMAQYVADDDGERCEFAVVVADHLQRRGLGKRLVQVLICIARAAEIRRMEGDILTDNVAMLRMMRNMGFTLHRHQDGAYLRKASMLLEAPEWKCSPLAALAAQEKTRRPAVAWKD